MVLVARATASRTRDRAGAYDTWEKWRISEESAQVTRISEV